MSYAQEIRAAAGRHGLDARLVAAVVWQESSFVTYAWNPEPRYRYLWDVAKRRPFRALLPDEVLSKVPPNDFPTLVGDRDQEWWGQQASWGLMQVMGAVARERGFLGPYLTQLTVPDEGLDVGCRHLAALMRWAGGDVERALAAYNGGPSGNQVAPYRNAAYAAQVLTRLDRAEERLLSA